MRGERPNPYGDGDGNGGPGTWRRIERGFGRFERSLRVPRGLNPDATTRPAALIGVLNLRISSRKALEAAPHPGQGGGRGRPADRGATA